MSLVDSSAPSGTCSLGQFEHSAVWRRRLAPGTQSLACKGSTLCHSQIRKKCLVRKQYTLSPTKFGKCCLRLGERKSQMDKLSGWRPPRHNTSHARTAVGEMMTLGRKIQLGMWWGCCLVEGNMNLPGKPCSRGFPRGKTCQPSKETARRSHLRRCSPLGR